MRNSFRSTGTIRLAIRVALIASLGFWQMGCITALLGGAAVAIEEEKDIVRLDPRFSFNVAEVPNWFPGEDAPLNDTERLVHLTKGAPDYIRFWWDKNGKFIKGSDFSGRMGEVSSMVKEVDRSWIYMDEGVEVKFPSRGGYTENDLEDRTRAVCEFGDPTSRVPPRMNRDGLLKENWRWVDQGVFIDFVDGAETRRRFFAGTGKGTFLGR